MEKSDFDLAIEMTFNGVGQYDEEMTPDLLAAIKESMLFGHNNYHSSSESLASSQSEEIVWIDSPDKDEEDLYVANENITQPPHSAEESPHSAEPVPSDQLLANYRHIVEITSNIATGYKNLKEAIIAQKNLSEKLEPEGSDVGATLLILQQNLELNLFMISDISNEIYSSQVQTLIPSFTQPTPPSFPLLEEKKEEESEEKEEEKEEISDIITTVIYPDESEDEFVLKRTYSLANLLNDCSRKKKERFRDCCIISPKIGRLSNLITVGEMTLPGESHVTVRLKSQF
jgi:hypothetical protein